MFITVSYLWVKLNFIVCLSYMMGPQYYNSYDRRQYMHHSARSGVSSSEWGVPPKTSREEKRFQPIRRRSTQKMAHAEIVHPSNDTMMMMRYKISFMLLVKVYFATLICSTQAFLPSTRGKTKITETRNLHTHNMPSIVDLRGAIGAEVSWQTSPKGHVSISLFSQKILHVVQSNPMLRNCFLCMALSAMGDLLAQQFEHWQKRPKRTNLQPIKEDPTSIQRLDIRRTTVLATFGFFVCGPFYSAWYPFVYELCRPWSLQQYGPWIPSIVKMVLELTFVEPMFLLSFFSYMNIAKGGSFGTLKKTIQSDFMVTYQYSLLFWPPIMLLSFRFVPVAALPIVVNIANAFWDAFLSYNNFHSTTPTNDDGDIVPVTL